MRHTTRERDGVRCSAFSIRRSTFATFFGKRELASTGSFVRPSSDVEVRRNIDMDEFPRSTGGVLERFFIFVFGFKRRLVTDYSVV